MAIMNTTQTISLTLCFKDGTNIKITENQAKQINEEIKNVLTDCLEGDNNIFDDIVIIDGEFQGSEYITDEFEYDIMCNVKVTIEGSYKKYKGNYSGSIENSYPDEVDWNPTTGWIKSYNHKDLVAGLKTISPIGNDIDYSSIKLTIYEYNEDGETLQD